MTPTYAGITTTISSGIANASTDQISLQNIGDLDVNIGDYLMVDDELMRVKTTTTGSNPVYVFRGILGSKATSHTINSVIRRVRVEPVELRRHSIIRASGHTFEYVGFGLVTILPHSQISRIVRLALMRNCYLNQLREKVESTSTPE